MIMNTEAKKECNARFEEKCAKVRVSKDRLTKLDAIASRLGSRQKALDYLIDNAGNKQPSNCVECQIDLMDAQLEIEALKAEIEALRGKQAVEEEYTVSLDLAWDALKSRHEVSDLDIDEWLAS